MQQHQCRLSSSAEKNWKGAQTLVFGTIHTVTQTILLLLLMAYASWTLPCPSLIARSPDWLPSSMQTRGRYSVASNPPQLHVAGYGWVFFGRFQSEGGFWIADATELWWSSSGELRMMWPKRRNLLSIMVWEKDHPSCQLESHYTTNQL